MKKFFTLIAALIVSAVGFAAAAPAPNPIIIDLSNPSFVTDANGTGNFNGEKLDYYQYGDEIYLPFVVETAGDYNLAIDYATVMSGLGITYAIKTVDGTEVWKETLAMPYTTPVEGTNDWSYVKTINTTTNATLAAGNYNLYIAYDVQGTFGGNPMNFTANIHKLVLNGVAGGSGNTPSASYEYLGGSNFDVDASDNNIYKFTGTDFTLSMNGRDKNRTPRSFTDNDGNVWSSDVINFKNNDWGIINVPAGKKVYALAIGGYSESTAGNLCYLYTVDVDDTNIFTEAIGKSVTDNTEIRNAKYVIEPDGTAPQFALLDLTAAPATNGIKVVFSGNNQEDVWFKLYVTEEDANAVLGKSSEGGETGKAGITWTVNTSTLTFDGTATPASNFTGLTYTVEGQEEATAAAPTAGENSGIDFLRYNPAEDKGNVVSTWTATLADGATFKVTNVSLRLARFGTDGGTVDLQFSVDGNEIFSETDLIPLRNNKSDADDAKKDEDNFVNGKYSKAIDNVEATQSIVLVATHKGLATNKQIGYAEILIEGESNGATGISEVQVIRVANGAIYNLAGQKVDANYKGVVIKNGKKYLQK